MPDADKVFITLYTDTDVHGTLAAQIRQHGFDAVSAYEELNDRLNDEQHLEYAAAHSRAVLTHNTRDFEPLYRRWWAAGKHHSGVIVSDRRGIGVLLKRALRLLNRVTADEMQDNLKYLAEFAERK